MPKDIAERAGTGWQDVLARGNEEAFHQLVDPYVEDLLKAARYDLEYYIAQGYLRDRDFTAEEIVGETQIDAWEHRHRCPQKMSVRGWLLGVQHRRLRQLVEQQQRYREDKAISLDEPISINPQENDKQEYFWDDTQSAEEVLLWEDIIPSTTPIDIEIDLDAVGREALLPLDASARHVLVMHDEFEVPLHEVAFIMGQSVNDIAQLLNVARADLRQRLNLDSESRMVEDDEPAPQAGSDE